MIDANNLIVNTLLTPLISLSYPADKKGVSDALRECLKLLQEMELDVKRSSGSLKTDLP